LNFDNLMSGHMLVKLVLAALVAGSFLYLRRRDTESAMLRYAFLGAFLALRDLAFALFPLPGLFQASDVALFGGLFFIRALSSRDRGSRASKGIAWFLTGLSLAAAIALGLNAFMDFAGETLELALWAAGPLLVVALAIYSIARRDETDTLDRELVRGTWIPLAIGSIVYLAAEAVLGTEHLLFQSLVSPLFYCLLLWFGFAFMDLSMSQLVKAVDYYEESIDSLYGLLLATGTAMKADFSLQDVLDNMISVLVERTGADGGVIVLTDEFEDTVSVRALHGIYPPPFRLPENLPRDSEHVAAYIRRARFKLGEGPLGETARSGKQLFLPSGETLPLNGEEDWLRSGGLIVAPLVVKERIIGAVSVAKTGLGRFEERDFDRCKLLADFGSIAVANSFTFLEAAERGDIEREAAIAADVQGALVPKKLPKIPGLALGSFTSPARGVCSDYFDVIQTRADRVVAIVGDVAGKGVAASLVMVMIRAIIHLITASAKDAATLLQWINRGVSGKVDLDHYATLGLVVADASGQLEYSNAGHQSPIVYRAATDSIETLDSKGVPIGVERTTAYASKRLALRPGDILVMYTDGVVEAMNEQGKQFGRAGLGTTVRRCHAMSAAEIAAGIKDDLALFIGRSRQHDDQTALVMKAKG